MANNWMTVIKKIAKNCRKYGLNSKVKEMLLKQLNFPKINIRLITPYNNWKYILKSTRILNAKHSGRVHLSLRGHIEGRSQPTNYKPLLHQLSKYLKSLTELVIYFSNPFKDGTLHQSELVITEISRNLTKIRRLTLDFIWGQTVNEDLLEIIGLELSKNLINLQFLKVSFGSVGANSDGVRRFLHPVKRYMTSLDCLVLNFSREDNGDDMLRALGDNLDHNLGRLKQLKVDFPYGRSNATAAGVHYLSLKIKENLSSLKSLELIFCSDYARIPLSKEFLKRLNEELKHIPKLRIA